MTENTDLSTENVDAAKERLESSTERGTRIAHAFLALTSSQSTSKWSHISEAHDAMVATRVVAQDLTEAMERANANIRHFREMIETTYNDFQATDEIGEDSLRTAEARLDDYNNEVLGRYEQQVAIRERFNELFQTLGLPLIRV